MAEKHTVEPGECIASIAFERGFFPDTLWKLAANSELRRARGNPNVLLPGDVVEIPDKRLGAAACVTAQRHVFRRRGVPEKLNIELRAENAPRADLAYVLTIDGIAHEGRTGSDGRVKAWIPPGARRGTLAIGEAERYELALGHLAPVSEEKGVRARLVSLGYLPHEAEAAPEGAAPVIAAVREFQRAQELEPTGVVDETTRRALVTVHGA
ncbi:peptidoglycan-binding protein [Sorangium sp. So ce590]|uniref:peptidoglycan-binding protein n=1 Tax=unclassified Sorangium TaxID=2621164 RepID=UPI003F5E9802